MNTQEREGSGTGTPSLLSRRTIALSAVWSVPVILAATAAPAAAASNPKVVGSGELVPQDGSTHPYALNMSFDVTGPPHSTTTITITKITASGPGKSGKTETFDLPPGPLSRSITLGKGTTGTLTVNLIVNRNGDASATAATVTFDYVETGSNGTFSDTGVAPVSITK